MRRLCISYSPKQKRGCLWLLIGVWGIFLCTQWWNEWHSNMRVTSAGAADYSALRQWDYNLRKKLLPSKALKDRVHISKEDLNATNGLALQRVDGIGVVLARHIIIYREMLGGFHNMSQLGEIAGIGKNVYERLCQRYTLGEKGLRTLRINEISAQNLAQHPYISDTLAAQLLERAPFLDATDLKARIALPPAKTDQLLPYLSFSQ